MADTYNNIIDLLKHSQDQFVLVENGQILGVIMPINKYKQLSGGAMPVNNEVDLTNKQSLDIVNDDIANWQAVENSKKDESHVELDNVANTASAPNNTPFEEKYYIEPVE